jgi:hypothetical protein
MQMPSPPFILLDNPIHPLVKTQKTTSNMKNILAVTTALLGIMLRGEGHFNPHGCQAKKIWFRASPGHNPWVV